jgi:hypothetical protein
MRERVETKKTNYAPKNSDLICTSWRNTYDGMSSKLPPPTACTSSSQHKIFNTSTALIQQTYYSSYSESSSTVFGWEDLCYGISPFLMQTNRCVVNKPFLSERSATNPDQPLDCWQVRFRTFGVHTTSFEDTCVSIRMAKRPGNPKPVFGLSKTGRL